jgi:hypothetical protein
MALLGAILPAWCGSRDGPVFVSAGNYFLSLAAGIVLGGVVCRRLVGKRGIRFQLVCACALACLAMVFLALAPPAATEWWRVAGLMALGFSAALLNVTLFQGISQRYQRHAADTVIRGGIWFGVGCLAVTLLAAGTFYAYSVPAILAIMTGAPAIFGAVYVKTAFGEAPQSAEPTLRQAIEDFRSPGAVLFAMLLFFQFGNEWSIAGWLPVFLLHRVDGISPSGALRVLALYWLFLMLGRLAAVAALPRIKHAWLLFGSGVAVPILIRQR